MPNNQQGQVALITTLIVISLALVMILGLNTLAIQTQQDLRGDRDSRQSYYLAESGLEDALLRIKSPDLNHEPSMTVTLSGHTAATTVTQAGNVYTVTGVGNVNNLIRSVSTTLTKNTTEAEFLYGVQVGDGGLEMKNNSVIDGSVYSNGNINGQNDPKITGDAWVAGANTLSNLRVDVDAHAHRIDDSDIGRDAYYQIISGSTVSGTKHPGSPDPAALAMPLSDEQITEWKNDAEAGGTRLTTLLDGDDTASLGPVKIIGNLTVKNNARLTLTGTIWVTGSVMLENDGVLELDDSFGAFSGVLLADGAADVKNNFIICGSNGYNSGTKACQAPNGSYVMLLSIKTSLLDSDPAITMQNGSNLQGLIYASAGVLLLKNNAALKEATAYRLFLENNATVTYESGLADVEFSSGPGGGWTFSRWQEVE